MPPNENIPDVAREENNMVLAFPVAWEMSSLGKVEVGGCTVPRLVV